MNMKSLFAAATIALTASVTTASAVSVSVDINIVQYANIADATAAKTTFLAGTKLIASESFETLLGASNPVTAVGSFTGLLPTFAGLSSIDCVGDPNVNNLARTTCVRSATSPDAVTGDFGRFATDGSNWLDSNDMSAVRWSIPGGATLSAFTHIAFFLTDIDDVGDIIFNITASGFGGLDTNVARSETPGRIGNGRLHLVTMRFTDFVEGVEILMTNGKNDGFGIDGVHISAVPVPASALLLLGGLGGLAAMRRRRKAA